MGGLQKSGKGSAKSVNCGSDKQIYKQYLWKETYLFKSNICKQKFSPQWQQLIWSQTTCCASESVLEGRGVYFLKEHTFYKDSWSLAKTLWVSFSNKDRRISNYDREFVFF